MNASIAIQVLPKVCADTGASGVMTYVKIKYVPSDVLTIEGKSAKYRED